MSGDGGSDRSAEPPGPYPIEGTALVKTAALASVPAERIPELLARVQADLEPRIDDYRRRYERIATEPDRETFLVEPDHWTEIGDRLEFTDRERDAVVRAHETAVERAGSQDGRRDEFETALEIRSGVVIGVPEDGGASGSGDGETTTSDDGETTTTSDDGEPARDGGEAMRDEE